MSSESNKNRKIGEDDAFVVALICDNVSVMRMPSARPRTLLCCTTNIKLIEITEVRAPITDKYPRRAPIVKFFSFCLAASKAQYAQAIYHILQLLVNIC